MDKYKIGDIVTIKIAEQEIPDRFGYITDIDVMGRTLNGKDIKVRWFDDGDTYWCFAKYIVRMV
jgi:hypothetical protein